MKQTCLSWSCSDAGFAPACLWRRSCEMGYPWFAGGHLIDGIVVCERNGLGREWHGDLALRAVGWMVVRVGDGMIEDFYLGPLRTSTNPLLSLRKSSPRSHDSET